MVKSTSRKQKVTQQGVQKRKVPHSRNEDQQAKSFFSSETDEKIGNLVAKRWHHIIQTTTKWLLIPIELEEDTGFARPACLWKRLIHCAIATVYFIIMMYKLIVTVHRALYVKLDLFTYMCACSFIVIFIPAMAFVSITFLPHQFCAVLNSWQPLLKLVEAKKGRKTSLFDAITVSLEVGCLVVIINTAAINTACYSLVGDIPNCVLPTLKNAGLIHTSSLLPKIVWRMLFLPVEILTLWPPMLVVGVAAMTMVLGLGMFNLYAEVVRNIKIRNVQSWDEGYMMYRTIQVYNAVLTDWLKVVSVWLPIGACIGIILTLYVTIRPSNIPLIIYPCFPLVAFMTMSIVTGLLMNAISTKGKTEQVLSNLQMTIYSQYIRRFDIIEKKICIRRIKSLRPVSLRIGNFAEASFGVTMNVWDEVLNQLVMLLSL